MNNDRNRRLVLGILLVAIVVATVGTTLAFFITQGGTNEEQKLTIKTGNLALTFEDNDSGLNASLSLGQTVTKEFKIINTGTEDVTTTMLWSGLVNTYLEESLQYKLQYKTSEAGTWQEANIAHGTIPHSETAKNYNLSKDITIPGNNTTYYYKLDITFLNLDSINQENDKTARLITKFNLGEKIVEGKNILAARGASYVVKNYSESVNYKEKLWAHRDNITSVVFENTISPKRNAEYTYDMSDYSSEGVKAYIVPNGETITNSDNSTSPAYTAYIQADGNIMANTYCNWLFGQFENLKSIEGLEYLDTSKVTDMSAMFSGCSSLINLNTESFITENVISMSNMFYNCSSLKNIKVNNFITSKVYHMNAMFQNCSSLTSLDLSNFDTKNVKYISVMFSGCSSLVNLDLSSFNTSKITTMWRMFEDCNSLTNLVGLNTFDTSKVTSMWAMFKNCSSLTSLDLSSFNMDNVTDVNEMLYGLSSNLKITVKDANLRDRMIEISSNPKLTASNFIIG